MQDIGLMTSDDGTLAPDSILSRVTGLFKEASEKSGRPAYLAHNYKEYFESAGFVDVVEQRLKWPINEWPKDPHYKELGAWTRENLDTGMDGLLLALFTRFLGWTPDEVTVFSAQVRAALKDRRVHAYMPVYVVYGRKPGDETGAPAAETT
ncbi:hypothetical protein VUR80DRAFT_2799 [Thermomyces stellatus]